VRVDQLAAASAWYKPLMPAKGSVLTGAAGENYVLHRLHLRGILASPAPPGARIADLLVFDPAMSVGSMIQVKTRTKGTDRGWHMSQKHETPEYVHPRLFYAFVDLEPTPPVVYVVPSRVVADVVARSQRAWEELPGKGGRPHSRETKFRRLVPKYPFDVPGLADGWLEEWKERWDLLSDEPQPAGATTR
jgi:hypothetical protein